MATQINMEKVTKRYNGIMEGIGLEYLTIGTNFSEDTENWNLRDMVAECDYQLSTYYEDGHSNHDLIHDDANEWRSETGKLKRFIARFKDAALEMNCTTNHCSNFDNAKPRAKKEEVVVIIDPALATANKETQEQENTIEVKTDDLNGYAYKALCDMARVHGNPTTNWKASGLCLQTSGYNFADGAKLVQISVCDKIKTVKAIDSNGRTVVQYKAV